MKSFPVLFVLLLSMFVDDALAAKNGRLSFVDEDVLLLATKNNNKGKADHGSKSTHVNFSSPQSPRVYKSAKQFQELILSSWHADSLKACYF